MSDVMPLDGWDHVELWVGNAKQSAHWYEHVLGFTPTAYAGPETGVRDRASYLLEQGEIRLVVTCGARPPTRRSRRSRMRHGDGVRDIALTVPDAEQRTATRSSVALAVSPSRGRRGRARRVRDGHDRHLRRGRPHVRRARRATPAPFCRATRRSRRTARHPRGVGLAALDHVVGNVELGKMNEWVAFYERVLGFENIVHFTEENINTEYSALMSKVMSDGERKIKFPINEPAEGRRKSQIQEYLDYNDGPGAQHIAMQTTDIVRTVEALRERGLLLLTTPETYYERPARTASARSPRTTPTCNGSGSSPTATRTATCSRSSRRTRRTGRRCSSR